MSNILFDRKASFTFGKPGSLGKSFTGLRLKFKIIKTSESAPNKSSVQIYNLSNETRGQAEKKDQVFILTAGFQTNEEVIFSGDVARVITELDGPDFVTTFEAGDGEKAYQSSRVDISFQQGANIKDVFNTLVSSFGKSIKDVSSIPSQNIINGISLTGLSRKHLDELTKKFGLEWSIQNDSIQILKKNKFTKEEAILLTPSTGLVGIPKKKEDGSLDLVSLLQPQIKPGRLIQVESRFVTGVFVCRKVTHSGDTHGTDWYSQIEAVAR